MIVMIVSWVANSGQHLTCYILRIARKTTDSILNFPTNTTDSGVSLSDFFSTEDAVADVNSYNGSLMEKVKAIEALSDEEKKTVFSIVDAFVGKKKLKDALSNVLTDVK